MDKNNDGEITFQEVLESQRKDQREGKYYWKQKKWFDDIDVTKDGYIDVEKYIQWHRY